MPAMSSRRARRRLGSGVAAAAAAGVCSIAVSGQTVTVSPRPTAVAGPATSAATAPQEPSIPARIAASGEVYTQFPPTQTPTAPPSLSARWMPPPGSGDDRDGNANLPWKVGVDKQLLDPRADEIASGQLHLGGYGLGPTRATTGPLVDGDGSVEHLFVRAMAVTNSGGQTMLLAGLENQGTFAADKQGPFGIQDIREQVSRDTGVPVDMIVVNSDHSHAGPDLIGLWGGVPISYLQHVHDQAVLALDHAFAARRPARLLVGTDIPTMPAPAAGHYVPGTATPGEYLVHSQFGADTQTGYPDDQVDTQLRVLQAVDGRGRPIGTLINYAAHATVMGGGNVQYSSDWPGRVARSTEIALREPVAVTMVADVGRSQPPRPTSDARCGQAGHPSCDVDQLDTYTRLLTPWVLRAVSTAVPVRGSAVTGAETFTREAATNPALIGVTYSGEVPVRGTGAYRAATAPWVAGNVIGTVVSTHRIGDVLLTAAPGEAYPDIRGGVAAQITGMQAVFTFGLANDQLGYIVAPTTEYGWITTSNPGNDNSFFNVAPQYGDHVLCTQTAQALSLGFTATGNTQPYGAAAPAPACAAIAASDAAPPGPSPQQPWPFGEGVTLPPPAPQ